MNDNIGGVFDGLIIEIPKGQLEMLAECSLVSPINAGNP